MPCKWYMCIFFIYLLELRNNCVYAAKLEFTQERDNKGNKYKINWQKLGIAGPARDMKKCNSAYAHAAVGAIEAQLWRWFPDHQGRQLSVQQLIDCDKSNYGCRGGYMIRSFDYLITGQGGLMFIEDYPTTGRGSPGKCKYKEDEDDNIVRVYGYTKVPPNENEMKAYLRFGPLAAAMDEKGFKGYKSGIIDGSQCNPNKIKLDVAVLIIGYDEEVDSTTNEKVPYWILRNNYGPDWGEKGNFRMKFGINACGITEAVSVPILKHTMPSK